MVKAQIKPSMVSLKQLAAGLAETHELSKQQAVILLDDFVGTVVKHLKRGERVKIGGLGILQVKSRAARIGRNPATGEAMHIKAAKKVAFRATAELKAAIGGDSDSPVLAESPMGGGGSRDWP